MIGVTNHIATNAVSIAGRAVWWLSGCVEDNGLSRRIPIQTNPFVIGRQSDLSLSLPCLTVSNHHAEIAVDGDLVWLRDLGSTNGTYVNGRRVFSEHALSSGDLVQFGNVIFEIASDSFEVETATISATINTFNTFFLFSIIYTSKKLINIKQT